MDKIIAEISFTKSHLDNDYTIYEDGTVIQVYDQNPYKLNQKRTFHVKEMDEILREKILNKCNPIELPLVQVLFKKYPLV